MTKLERSKNSICRVLLFCLLPLIANASEPLAPPVITSLVVAPFGEVTLTWSPLPGKRYRVTRALDPMDIFDTICTLLPGTATFTDTYPRTAPGTYYYRLFYKTEETSSGQYSPFSLIAPPVKRLADYTLDDWTHKFDLINARRNDYSLKPNSGTLCWGESSVLRSYLTMYEVTGQVRYLEKLTARARDMTSSLRAWDLDTGRGWYDSYYSKELAVNGSFSAAVIDRAQPALIFFRGQTPLVVDSNGSTWSVKKESFPGYVPGATYRVSFRSRNNLV